MPLYVPVLVRLACATGTAGKKTLIEKVESTFQQVKRIVDTELSRKPVSCSVNVYGVSVSPHREAAEICRCLLRNRCDTSQIMVEASVGF
jgi:hypothetical protein